MGWVLAVDFGTVNTAAAWQCDGRIERVRLEPSSDTMPSAVVLVDGRWRVGQAALNARRANPDTFIAAPKTRLGQEPVLLGTEPVRASTMVSKVFAVVRDRSIAAAGGTGPDKVVLTHPAHWGSKRQAALLKAAALVGFANEHTTLLPEPVAAARASVEPESLAVGSRVAVVDIGGGTCDVAVLEAVAGQQLMVVAREGDERLGGDDFDHLLYQWVLGQLEASGRGDMVAVLADPAHNGVALTLLDSVRSAKQDLSDHPDTKIVVSVAAGNETTVTITRDEYEQVIAEPLRRIAALARSTLEASGTTVLAHLFLTGGSAYTPAVARVLYEATGHLSAPLGDPKSATSTGALRAVLHDGGQVGGASVLAAPAPAPSTTRPVRTRRSNAQADPTTGRDTAGPGTSAPRRRRQLALAAVAAAAVLALGLGVGAWRSLDGRNTAGGPDNPAEADPGQSSPQSPAGLIPDTLVPSDAPDDEPPEATTAPEGKPGEQTPPENPPGGGQGGAGNPPAPVTLTVASAVATKPHCVGGPWVGGPVTMGGTSYSSALVCTMWNDAFRPSLDYTVPAGATTFTATIGLADTPEHVGTVVLFTVVNAVTDAPLMERRVTYGEPVSVSVPISGQTRIRLEAVQVVDGVNDTKAVWGSPRIS